MVKITDKYQILLAVCRESSTSIFLTLELIE